MHNWDSIVLYVDLIRHTSEAVKQILVLMQYPVPSPFFLICNHTTTMTTTTTKYKKEKKGKQKRKKLVPTCKIYATKLIIQLTIQRRMTYLHNITYISFLIIILPTNLTLHSVDLPFFIVVLPGVTYNVTF